MICETTRSKRSAHQQFPLQVEFRLPLSDLVSPFDARTQLLVLLHRLLLHSLEVGWRSGASNNDRLLKLSLPQAAVRLVHEFGDGVKILLRAEGLGSLR